jgi:hypothetical protein
LDANDIKLYNTMKDEVLFPYPLRTQETVEALEADAVGHMMLKFGVAETVPVLEHQLARLSPCFNYLLKAF